jgi:hypothetical protein
MDAQSTLTQRPMGRLAPPPIMKDGEYELPDDPVGVVPPMLSSYENGVRCFFVASPWACASPQSGKRIVNPKRRPAVRWMVMLGYP